jgi:hypothetical protein
VDEEQPRLHVELMLLTVDGERDLDGAHLSPLESPTPVGRRPYP